MIQENILSRNQKPVPVIPASILLSVIGKQGANFCNNVRIFGISLYICTQKKNQNKVNSMTKRLFIFALMLMAAVGMQAQSLTGTWKTTMTEGEEKMDFYFIFTQSSMTMKGSVSQFDREVGTIAVSVKVPCTYTHSGNKLNVKTNPDQVTLTIDKMDFIGEIAEAMKKSPELKKMIKDQVQKSMQDSKGEIVKEFPQGGELDIISLTDTKLTLRDNTGETIHFTKVR